MENNMNISGRRNFGNVSGFGSMSSRNSSYNTSVSRGQFLRTAGIAGGAIATAGLGFGGVGAAKAQTVPKVLNVPSQYPTIQAAIDAANPGDTIMVAAGNYRSVYVSKAVNIIGTTDTHIISGGELEENGFGFYMDVNHANGATIRQFTIDCDNYMTGGAYIRLGENITLSNLTINNSAYAIFSRSAKKCTITNNTINGFNQTYDDVLGLGGEAIAIFISGKSPGSVNPKLNLPADSNLIAFNTINAVITDTNPDAGYGGIVLETDEFRQNYRWNHPVRYNKVVHNTSVVKYVGPGIGPIAAGFVLSDGQAANGDGPVVITDNEIGFNDFRGSTIEIVSFPEEAITNPVYKNILSRNLGENRAADGVPAKLFRPKID